MDKITTLNNIQDEITVLPNKFIDEYMLKADGEYVKIYLLILRLQNMGLPVEADQLADRLELTRKDVLRALAYWEKAGLLKKNREGAGSGSTGSAADTGQAGRGQTDSTARADNMARPDNVPADSTGSSPSRSAPDVSADIPAGVPSAPVIEQIVTVPTKSSLSPAELESSIKGTDLERTIFAAEAYLGRPLGSSDLNSFCYITDQLHFSSDLLEYLIEYCVTRGKKSVRYIESVAISWYQQSITTVKEAKAQSVMYTQNVFPVMKAFGISNRDPGSAELDYIRKWNSLGLGTDLIVEACSRTLLSTHQASFPYANKILEEWSRLGVRSMADVRLLDEKRRSTAGRSDGTPAAAGTSPQGGTGSSSKKSGAGSTGNRRAASNQFHNFEQRTYDYSDLESRLLDKNRR